MLRSVFVLLIVCCITVSGKSQCPFQNTTTSTVLNGSYVPHLIPTSKVIPNPHLREADVMWSKRVWRVIDLRQKMNHSLYYPLEPTGDRSSLWDLLKCSLYEGQVTAYNPGPLLDDDEFKVPYTLTELQEIFVSYDTVWTVNPDTDEMEPVPVEEQLESREIKQYMLKEDWFFDRQRSVLECRIIGMAPMREIKGQNGEIRGYSPVFWLYFPEVRYVLRNALVFNRQNNVHTMSFDDLFQKRYFSSYIVKESNVFDRKINEYLTGTDALLEAEKLKRNIFKVEHDLWHY